MARAATWIVGLRLFNRGIGFVSTLILARLLVPAEFGLVAMGTALQALLLAISNFSLDVPLIQKPHIDRTHMDSGWSLQILLGIAQAAILLALVEPAVAYYDTPKVANVLYVLAGICLIKGGSNIGVVMFQREMEFHKEFMLMGARRLAMVGITLPFAFVWASYWALLAGMLGGAITECVLSYVMHPYRPSWNRQRWGELIRFSRWLLASNSINFINDRGPDLVLGGLIGPQAVGFFSVGAEIGRLPSTELVAPINRATLPAYSRLNETSGRLKKAYLEVTGIVALVAVPATVGLAATASLLVPLLLGPNWLKAVPVVHYIALAGALGVLFGNAGSVFMAIGKPWILTLLKIVRLLLIVPGMLFGATYAGVAGVAQAYLAVACIMVIINLAALFFVFRLGVFEYLCAVGRPLVAAALMYGIVRVSVVPWLAASTNLPLLFASAIAVLMGAVVFIGVTVGLWGLVGFRAGAERRAMSIVCDQAELSIASLQRRFWSWM